MSLKQRIDGDLKAAMKARDAAGLSATRLLKTEVVKLEIEQGRDADDVAVIRLVDKQLRQRKESIEQYLRGGRKDLVDIEEKEAAFLARYLPAPLSPQELEALVTAAIAEVKALSPRDMGAVMKAAQAKAEGRVDGRTLSELVKKRLSTPA